MRIIKNITVALMFLAVFNACQNNEWEDEIPEINVKRTIIAYLGADNDLSMDALVDIEEMKQGFSSYDVNLLVFADLQGEDPYLLKIGTNKEETIKTYPELNSAEPAVLKRITEEVMALYPAEEYGLILWSHGTSWMPSGSGLRSFGKDSGKGMNLVDLAENLPVKFDFILFDACLMGSVEVAYELKDKTDYLIASSTETIYEGFPYDKIVPELTMPHVDLSKEAQHYFDYYNSLSGAYRSATIAVIDTKELTRLAEETNRIVSEYKLDASFERSSVQRLDVYGEQYAFDLADFIAKASPDADKSAFQEQLGRAVLYRNATPMFLSEYDISTYCGLSCYIFHPDRQDLNRYYKTLKWHEDAGLTKWSH